MNLIYSTSEDFTRPSYPKYYTFKEGYSTVIKAGHDIPKNSQYKNRGVRKSFAFK